MEDEEKDYQPIAVIYFLLRNLTITKMKESTTNRLRRIMWPDVRLKSKCR